MWLADLLSPDLLIEVKVIEISPGKPGFFVLNMQKLMKKFNQEDSLLVITSYPFETGEGAKQNAIACYSQNLLSSYNGRNVVVLADKDGHPKTIDKKGNILVVRTWKPGSFDLFIKMISMILRFGRVRDILIQFEFNMLGSVILTSLLPLFIATLKILGKRVTVTQHQVVDDLGSLSGHLNVPQRSLKNAFLTFGLHSFYSLLGLFSDSIIVHEEVLKERLSKWVNPDKIFVISHGLTDEEKLYSKNRARKSLQIKKDDFIVLLFGYIAWYKGTDWLIKKVGEISKTNKKIKLIVVGGPSATLKSKAHYRKYLESVKKLSVAHKNSVKMVDYLPDGEVGKYFSACDLVVLPYRTMMSASGPLSFALRFNRPFIVSNSLSPIFRNYDLQRALGEAEIDQNDITFSLEGQSFENKLLTILSNKNLYRRVGDFVKYGRTMRSWDRIVLNYEEVIGLGAKVEEIPSIELAEEAA